MTKSEPRRNSCHPSASCSVFRGWYPQQTFPATGDSVHTPVREHDKTPCISPLWRRVSGGRGGAPRGRVFRGRLKQSHDVLWNQQIRKLRRPVNEPSRGPGRTDGRPDGGQNDVGRSRLGPGGPRRVSRRTPKGLRIRARVKVRASLDSARSTQVRNSIRTDGLLHGAEARCGSRGRRGRRASVQAGNLETGRRFELAAN